MARNPFLRLHSLLGWALLTCSLVSSALSDDFPVATPRLPTVTVRGFLNFRTTVDGTVIVFTPAASAVLAELSRESATFSAVQSDAFRAKEGLNSREGLLGGSGATFLPNSLGIIKSPQDNLLENKLKDPFLPHISDNVVLFSVGEMNELEKIKKLQPSPNPYPTGLVTVLGGTLVDGTWTTVYETKVTGTYIDGKYAQILHSTSHIVNLQSPTATLPVSDSITKHAETNEKHQFSNSLLKDTRLTHTGEDCCHSSPARKPKSSYTTVPIETKLIESTSTVPFEEITATAINPLYETKSSQERNTISTSFLSKEEIATPPAFPKKTEKTSFPTHLESSFMGTFSGTPERDHPTETLESSFMRKSSTFRSVLSSLDEDKIPRSTSRNRFLPPRRQSQTVRLNRFKVKLTLRQDELNATLPSYDEDLEDLPSKDEDEEDGMGEDVSISVDPAKVVFQETTITSEVTLHVGRRKSVRTLTITTSIPLTVNPTDIQDILSSQSTAMDKSDDSRHIVTKTFTTTERALKTSVVPIFDGKSTVYHTVTESFFIMKIITAYRTLPYGDPSILESFRDDPEPTTTLETTSMQPSRIHLAAGEPSPAEDDIVQSSISLLQENSQPHITHTLLSLGHALSNNPLAAVYLGLQQLNAQMTLYSTVTDVSTYVTTETVYSTKSIRFYDGRSTRHRMISDPISTTRKTVTETRTSVQPYLNTHALQQQQQLQKLIAPTQLSPRFNTVTTTYTTVTTATSLSTRIYTLIYNGFSTKFRTVTSSTLYPTTVTITSTTKLLITPTQGNLPFVYPYTSRVT